MLSRPLMHLGRRLALGTFSLSTLLAAQVGAQPAPPLPSPPPAPLAPPTPLPPPAAAPAPTESLEAPYEEPPAAPAVTPPASPAVTPPASPRTAPKAPGVAKPPRAEDRSLGPIRARRRLALTGELGWNGLAGFGPVLTYYAHPNVAFDLGAGVSLFGWKGGARGRYNFLKSPATPFVGLGFNATSGLGEARFDAEDPSTGGNPEPVTIDLKATYLYQVVAGLDFVHKNGFTLIGSLGYTWVMNDSNYEVVAGKLNSEQQRAVDIVWGDGPVISLSLGYAFE